MRAVLLFIMLLVLDSGFDRVARSIRDSAQHQCPIYGVRP